ncbi:MAG TPA: hypothetical protein VJ836_02820 [Candidatus Saccharimonadales bacterium]|nr:hypothetical protein [Candidatus Saccharimonadales bacterium]
MGISALLLPALATAIVTTREGRVQELKRIEATALLRETDEAVRSVREKGWAQFAVNGTYFPAITGSTWSLTAGTQTIGNFTRQVVISDAQRSATGAIVASGGTVDSSTKRVVTTVSWTQPFAATVSNETYYQRYLNNAAWSQTTQAEFNAGTFVNTVSTSTGGGAVQLATTPGIPNWGSPSVVGGYNASGNQDALDVFTVGNFAYLSDGTVMTILNITTPATPTLVGTYTASGTINHVYVDGNFAYLSTTSDSAELTVVNITNPASPVLAGTENLPGNADARAAFVVGGFAYMGRVSSTTSSSREFQILNVSNPANPAVAGGIDMSGTVNNIKVSGNFAYLATTIDTQELVVVNVTNKNSPTTAGSYNAAGSADANDLGIDGNTVYLAEVNNTSGAEVFSINVTTPSSPSLLDTFEVGGAVTGVSVLNGYAFLSTAITNRQLIVLDAAAPNNLLLEANVNLGSSANDVKAHGSYTYMATASNTQELMIVGPAIGPSGFQPSGTFDSSTFDAGASAAYNYITFTITEPASTNVRLQIAANDDNTTWNYVGPDGTAATFYDVPGTIRLNTAGRYLRYRATLSGPGTSTPVFSDISINYSP